MLALVVPDPRTNVEVQVLNGTNTIDILYAGFNEGTTVSPHCEYASLVRHLQSIYVSREQQDGHWYLILCSYIMVSPRQTLFKVPILLSLPTTSQFKPIKLWQSSQCHYPSLNWLTPMTSKGKCKTQINPTPHASVSQLVKWILRTLSSLTLLTPLEFKLNFPGDFAGGDLDYGHMTVIKHKICLSNPIPFKQRARLIHPSHYEAVHLHLNELYDANIRREYDNPFASPIALVKKKNGQIHLCVDYRKLNRQHQGCLCFATHRRGVCIPDRSKAVFFHEFSQAINKWKWRKRMSIKLPLSRQWAFGSSIGCHKE